MDAEERDYVEADMPAVLRMWREVGWIDDEDREAEALAAMLGYGAGRVGVVDGEAECLVHRTPGTIRYDQRDLSLSAVTAVTTSAIARNMGLATRLTAASIAAAGAEGAAVAALGMFEQGFYNRFGLGTLSYGHVLSFDPARLLVAPPRRRPVRVGRGDWEDLAALMARRWRPHGGVALDPTEALRAELGFVDDPYLGLGFRDDAGHLTACMVGTNTGEHGPYRIGLLAYEGLADLLDLLGLLRTLSAQVHEVRMDEPAGIQLQDLIATPIRGSEPDDPGQGIRHQAAAWYQLRILDLAAVVSARSWPGPEVAFDMVLTDPLSDADLDWPGLAGDHTITIGDSSTTARGHRGGLPVLRASVSALSRLWFGVRPATGLALTDDLDGPPELLAALDRALLLPPPSPSLQF